MFDEAPNFLKKHVFGGEKNPSLSASLFLRRDLYTKFADGERSLFSALVSQHQSADGWQNEER